MEEDYPTGDRNDADGMHVGDGSESDVENFWRDIGHSENGAHGGIEADGSNVEEIAHENENGFDSRVKDDVREIRDEHVPGSRTGTEGMKKLLFCKSFINLHSINIIRHSYRPYILINKYHSL